MQKTSTTLSSSATSFSSSSSTNCVSQTFKVRLVIILLLSIQTQTIASSLRPSSKLVSLKINISSSFSQRLVRLGSTTSFASSTSTTSAFVLLRGGKRVIDVTSTTASPSHPKTLSSRLFSSKTQEEKENNSKNNNMNIAIIGGGGAAGLAATRIFSRYSNPDKIASITVLEQDLDVGGIWRHVENDRTKPMYRGLRTNLPRELMAFREKPWGSDGVGDSYVTHKAVNSYLKEYATDFDIEKYISFGCTVTQLTMLDDDTPCSKISLTWENSNKSDETTTKEFDAVVICNGHFASPSIPPIAGLSNHFQGKILHSIEYDDPNVFKDKTVLCIGGRASGSDLAREISAVATKVYLSDSTCSVWASSSEGQDEDEDENDANGEKKAEEEDALGQNSADKQCGNVIWVPRTERVEEGSVIHFGSGCTIAPDDVDVIVFCSGYDYSFPFINEKSNLDFQCIPGERRVSPLYEQLWHAKHTNLAFIGLPNSVLPFPLFELQSEAIVAQLFEGGNEASSSAVPIPTSVSERMEEALVEKEKGGPDGGRVQDTHFLGSHQWDYCRQMAKRGGVYDEEVENYIATNKAIYDHSGSERKGLFPGGPDTYRSTKYKRDNANQSFEIISSKKRETNTVGV